MADQEGKFTDIKLICKDCGKEFIFPAADQKFYAKQGFTNAPARCKDCRIEFQNKKYKGQEVYNVRCKNCGKVGKLTVQPTHPKEVICGECFAEALEKEKYGHLPSTLKEALDRISSHINA